MPSRLALHLVCLLRDFASLSAKSHKAFFSLGITGGIFPIPCTTTIVCGVFIYLFKLNIAACQLFNVLLTPVELMLVLPFIRLGEFIFFSQPLPFSAAELADKLSSNFFGTLSTLGMSFFRAVIAWMLVSFLLTFLLYHALRFILQRTMPKRLMH